MCQISSKWDNSYAHLREYSVTHLDIIMNDPDREDVLDGVIFLRTTRSTKDNLTILVVFFQSISDITLVNVYVLQTVNVYTGVYNLSEASVTFSDLALA